MHWHHSPPVSLHLVISFWLLLAAAGGKRRGPDPDQPACPSHSCKCKWAGGRYNHNDIRVKCLDVSGHIPTFTQTNVTFLSLSLPRRNITRVPDYAFAEIATRSLDLSDNWLNTVGCISSEAFQGQGETLQTLILRDNGLPYIPIQSLSVLHQLRKLHLEHNNISHVPALAFVNNSLLHELYLYNNRIQSLALDSFVGLGNIEHLKLMGNNLRKLPDSVFEDQKRLRSLDLSQNDLASLPPGVFRGLWKLKWLELQANQLTTIDRNTFRGLKKLQHVRLESNPLVHVGYKSLHTIRKIRYLSFEIINVVKLNPQIFKGLGKLKMLVLGEVDSKVLPASVFSPLTRVKYMTIFNNTGRFESLSEDVFPTGMDISGLKLWVEPVGSCKCSVPWVKALVARGVWLQGKCGRNSKRLRRLSCLHSQHSDAKNTRRKIRSYPELLPTA